MQKLFEKKSDCFGCEVCSAVCPQGAITMERDIEGFVYPKIDSEMCIACGLCEEVCPGKHSLAKTGCRAYAVRCKDEKVLYGSTSGGAFSLIASYVLEEGGLVCGAVFDKDFNVVHILSKDIGPMRKSKYIQSSMGSCLKDMEQVLKEGKDVLFSGTPCQCHGIKMLLGKYSGLHFVSLVCHGVTSPGLWADYRSWLENNGKLKEYCFRDKRRLNDAHTVAYTVSDSEKTAEFQRDPWCRIYVKSVALRPSCYKCAYCFPERDFDFSIGDFWGIDKVYPELADGKGTSLVIAGSDWAHRVIEKIRTSALVLEVKLEQSLQESLIKPVKEPILRRFLFADFVGKGPDGCCDVPLLLKKYGC